MDFFSAPEPAAPDAFPELTDREREILDLIAAGTQQQEIATQLT